MQITRNSLETNAGPSDWFTGSVYIDTIAAASGPSRLGAASVLFTPGARTAWHTHPLAKPSTSPRASAAASARGIRSRRSAPATACSSSQAKTTGTAPRPTAS